MAFPYITQTQLENRIGTHNVRRVCDDDNDGVADAAVVTSLLTDSSAIVRGHLKGVLDLTAVAASPPEEVVRLTLDVAVAFMAMRAPEVMMMNGQQLRNRAEADCKAFRENKRGASGFDAENEGGEINCGDPDEFDEDEYEPVFQWGTPGF